MFLIRWAAGRFSLARVMSTGQTADPGTIELLCKTSAIQKAPNGPGIEDRVELCRENPG
jgi:hypothetical protein